MSGRYDVELVAVTKRYGATTAVDDVSLRIPEELLLPAGTERLRQDHDAAHDRRPRERCPMATF